MLIIDSHVDSVCSIAADCYDIAGVLWGRTGRGFTCALRLITIVVPSEDPLGRGIPIIVVIWF
jgi:hypothetical protein